MSEARWATIERVLRRTGALQFLLGLLSITGYVVVTYSTDFRLPRWWMPTLGWLGLLLMGTGGVSLIAVYSFRNRRLRPLLLGCELVLQATLVAWIVLLLVNGTLGGPLWENLFVFPVLLSVTSGMLIFAGLALSFETTSAGLHLMQRVVAASLSIGVMLFLATIVLELPDWMYPITTVWSGVAMIGVGVLPAAIRRAEQPRGRIVRTLPRKIKLTHTCPGCSEWIESRPGPARCDWCGLRMLIEVAEPRCTCGYLLYELQGESCPECGRRIDDAAPAAASPA